MALLLRLDLPNYMMLPAVPTRSRSQGATLIKFTSSNVPHVPASTGNVASLEPEKPREVLVIAPLSTIEDPYILMAIMFATQTVLAMFPALADKTG